tara:strand:- start:706 stop:1437 length:732 start_codon:yes stop_codon:yes gene_type:complete
MGQRAPKKKLIILDIDQTLIHSVPATTPVQTPGTFLLPLPHNETYHVHTRRHLKTFINAMRRLSQQNGCKIAIWTAAQRDYATRILNKIWPTWSSDLLFFRSFQHCSKTASGDVFKDLRRLPQGYDFLLVDDSPVHYSMNTANNFSVWKIKPFDATSSAIDNELLHVLAYIDHQYNNSLPFTVRPKTPSGCATFAKRPHTPIRRPTQQHTRMHTPPKAPRKALTTQATQQKAPHLKKTLFPRK